jgi:hypothetical protein
MSSRKQEKERLRQERIEAERRASADARKRLILGYVVAGILGVAVVGGAVYAIASSGGDGGSGGGGDDSDNVATEFGFLPDDLPVDEREGTTPPEVVNGDLVGAANVAGCELRLDLRDEGSTHFGEVDRETERDTNPPTSGDHFAPDQPNAAETGSGALADGAFLETPPENRTLHSLEHSRVIIQYSPDLPEEDQLALKGVFDEQPEGILLFPDGEMPYDVAVTAWTQLVGCESFDGQATLDVVRTFRDQYLGRGPEAVPLDPDQL